MRLTALFALLLAFIPMPESKCQGAVNFLTVESGVDYVASCILDDSAEPIPDDKLISMHSAVPVNFKYGFIFTNPEINHYLPGGYQGISIGLKNFGALESRGLSKSTCLIGYPVSTYIFQGGPFWHIRKNLSLNYEWNFGAAYGWKPYSSNNENYSIRTGSRVNAYLGIKFYFTWQINPHLGFSAGLGASHYSNGNTSYPNPGINSFGLNLGITYTINPINTDYLPAMPDTIKRRKVVYDISAWGASRKRLYRGISPPVLLPGHFACAGISFSPLVRLNTWWRVGGSLDLQWDESSDMKRNYIEGRYTDDIKFTRPSFIRQVSAGLSAHGELRMPIFAVNVGIGYNLVAPEENRGSYQDITLKTYIIDKIYLNVGYQLRNFYQQGSLMLGLGVSL